MKILIRGERVSWERNMKTTLIWIHYFHHKWNLLYQLHNSAPSFICSWLYRIIDRYVNRNHSPVSLSFCMAQSVSTSSLTNGWSSPLIAIPSLDHKHSSLYRDCDKYLCDVHISEMWLFSLYSSWHHNEWKWDFLCRDFTTQENYLDWLIDVASGW